MKISEAKEVKIIDYLEMNGFSPLKIVGGKAWFFSLLRSKEKTASFIINLQENTWHDYGTGEHGDIINLVSKLNNVDVSDALELIGKFSFTPYHPFEYSIDENIEDKGKIRINQTLEITHQVLIRYIAKRKVSLSFARKFLKEAHYSLHERNYFALAFKNDLGGYELRNEHFKIGNSPKFFTTIPGNDPSKVNIFEGFMDFLSCCTYFNKVPKYRTIVLNSLSFLPRIKPFLVNAAEVNLYLDNDSAGRIATENIISSCGKVTDCAPILYPYHKDFNEFLTGKIQCIPARFEKN